MNLTDLLQRNDRSVSVVGSVTPAVVHRRGGAELAVRLEPDACLKLTDAHEFHVLRTHPTDPGLTRIGDNGFFRRSDLTVEMVAGSRRQTLWRSDEGASPEPVRLSWPLGREWVRYDLEIHNRGRAGAWLAHGRRTSSAGPLLPWLSGDGVEVGPGAAPFLRPAEGRRVVYVEEKSAADWKATYNKNRTDRPAVDPVLWDLYRQGDARTLDCIAQGTQDFVFSKHVLEHLVDPIGVFEAWASRLRPGGVIAGVVPDLDYTFDLRQSPTTREEFLTAYRERQASVTREQYERWCRWTAPYNTPEDLVARNYSIHVSYFTAESFRDFLELVSETTGVFDGFTMTTERNNKDFGFLLWKRGLGESG